MTRLKLSWIQFCQLLLLQLCAPTVFLSSASLDPITCACLSPASLDQSTCDPTARHEQQGTIRSPQYPERYPANAQCKWHIYHETFEVVTISFQAMDIEETDGSTCTSDYLRITDKVASLYCGSDIPIPFISQKGGKNSLVLNFQSDGSEERGGFLLEYFIGEVPVESCSDPESQFFCQLGKCIPRSWVCNGMDECGDRSDEAIDVCQQEPTETSTQPTQCPPHFIYCLTMDTTPVPQCLPEDRKCDGNQDCFNDVDEIGCEVVCSHELEMMSGSFSSPNFGDLYGNNLDCRWTLVVPEGNIIQLRFVYFELELNYHTDYVTVYDGSSVYSDIIGTYYGYNSSNPSTRTHLPPPVIEGSGNRLYVTFITDGSSVSKGFNATFQTRGHCLEGQRQCSKTDLNCYAANQHCDGELTCLQGEDEQGCLGCPDGKIPCSTKQPVKCYSAEERCNGQPRCSEGNEDELNCPAQLCNDQKGLFLCGTGRCIQENWWCDTNQDCADSSDEMNCPMSPKVITAAVVGSIVCGLLLVAALSCTCKLYQLYHSDPHPPTHTSPLSEIEDELMRREAPPSYTASMSSPHFDEAQRTFIESLQAAARGRGDSRGRHSSGRSGTQLLGRGSRNGSNGGAGHETEEQARENGASSPTSANTTQDTLSTTESATTSPTHVPTTATQVDETTSGDRPADDNSSPYTEIAELRQPPSTDGGDAVSSSTTDTDSDTNAEAEVELRDHVIIRAATNIRRIRLAGGIQNIVDTVTNRQRGQGASRRGGQEDGARRASGGLQHLIQRINRTRESQQAEEPDTHDAPEAAESSLTGDSVEEQTMRTHSDGTTEPPPPHQEAGVNEAQQATTPPPPLSHTTDNPEEDDEPLNLSDSVSQNSMAIDVADETPLIAS